MENKIIYYSDELNDEFAGDSIQPRKIDESYDYGNASFGWTMKSFFWYRIVALPLAKLYLSLKWHHKIINKKVLRPYRKTAYFTFANHTHFIADALVPTLLNFPKKVFVIVHPNNVSMPLLGKITPYLGALPLPDNIPATRNFMDTIKLRVQQKKVIHIYPEAHIWPFYTKIRPFLDMSFRYPVQYKAPTFCYTDTYQKRRFSSTPRLVTYIDGPFFPPEDLSAKEQRKWLRDRCYEAMCERAKNNNVEMIKYIKKENGND